MPIQRGDIKKQLLFVMLLMFFLFSATFRVSANEKNKTVKKNNAHGTKFHSDSEKRKGFLYPDFGNLSSDLEIEAEENSAGEMSDALLPVTVRGIVKDSTGNVLAGVSISVAGKNKTGVISDEDGGFTIQVEEGSVLEISSVGYLTQKIAVSARTSTLNITLVKAANDLSEVVVVGYGVQARQKITSAVTGLKTDNFKDAPYTDVQSAIAGRAPGVIVSFSGGEPGSIPNLTIRGGETNIGVNAPLYVIDGVIRERGAFVALNINDIESMSFLKDASATAVFGSKAAGGIVLVTTKRGKTGKARVVYSNNFAFNTPANFPELISGYDKARVANAIGEASGQGKYSAYNQGQLDTIRQGLNPEKYPNTDWYDLTFRKYAFQQSHNVSMSGGGDQTTYYVGLGYFGQGSNYVNNSFQVQRFSYNAKVASKFGNTGLGMAFGINGYYTNSTQPPAGSWAIFSHIVARSPFEHAFNTDGTLAGLVDHPLAEINSPGYAKSENYFNNGNLAFTWEVPWVKGLSLRAMGDYAVINNPTKTFTALATQYNADGSIYQTPKPSLSEYSGTNSTFNVEFQADYSRTFNKHSIGATFVSITRGGMSKWMSAARQNFPSAAIDQMFAGDASTQVNNGSADKWGEVGYVGRIKYDYAAKYLLEISGRYDGSDLFPESKRFGLFPAVSAGWVLSSEKFYTNANLDRVFSYFKLKASYGETGAVNGIGRYAYVPRYLIAPQTFVVNGNLQNGYYEGPLTIQDQNITWYAIRSSDLGFEFEALNKKLTGGFDYFYTEAKNILGNPAFRYTEPLGQALPSVLTDATSRKEGIDGYLNYSFNITKELSGFIGFNFTYYKTIWVRTNEDSASLTNPFTRAQGVVQNYYGAMYQSNGLYQNTHDILSNPSRVTSTALGLGDVWYADANGDGKIDAQDFRRAGNAQSPAFSFGVPFGLQFRGFRLDGLIQGTGNRDVYLGTYLMGGEGVGRVNYDFQKDFWLADNTGSSFPRAGISSMNDNNNYASSTFWLKNAGFVRLKSLMLSYDLKPLLGSAGKKLSELSVHVGGTNLITISNVKKYFDPELADANNFFYPVNKTYTIGFRLGL